MSRLINVLKNIMEPFCYQSGSYSYDYLKNAINKYITDHPDKKECYRVSNAFGVCYEMFKDDIGRIQQLYSSLNHHDCYVMLDQIVGKR